MYNNYYIISTIVYVCMVGELLNFSKFFRFIKNGVKRLKSYITRKLDFSTQVSISCRQ